MIELDRVYLSYSLNKEDIYFRNSPVLKQWQGLRGCLGVWHIKTSSVFLKQHSNSTFTCWAFKKWIHLLNFPLTFQVRHTQCCVRVSQCRETYCSFTTKMQLSWEGTPDTGCLQVTFRSLWLQGDRQRKETVLNQQQHTRNMWNWHRVEEKETHFKMK